MYLKFTTKRDVNGNRYTLEIDTDKKTYNRSYNTSNCYEDYITITKRDREKLAAELENAGYTRIF